MPPTLVGPVTALVDAWPKGSSLVTEVYTVNISHLFVSYANI